jgi:Transposase DDE domain
VLHPHHALLAAARAFATTDAFDDTYRQHRPMVERSIAWLVRGANHRLRYRGTDRNQLWLTHRVAAVNLNRLVNLGLTHRPDGWAIA